MAKKKVEEAKQDQHVSLEGYVPNLQKKYKEEIVAKLQKEFGFATVMQVPKLMKITLNQGIGDATGDKKLVEVAQQELTAIAGQKAVTTYSRKDISNFKLRRGTAIGVKVTLRGARMYEFLERLIAVSLPRIRDFNGINEKFDGKGNYTTKIKKQTIHGTYTFNSKEKTITFKPKFGKEYTAHVSVQGKEMTLVFNADKLMNILKGISNTTATQSTTAATINALLKSYNGMRLGFKLKK
mgnify:CR=1 FL=1